MASWDVFRDLDNLRREIDEAFRGAGYNRPFGSAFLSPVATRRFPLVNNHHGSQRLNRKEQ